MRFAAVSLTALAAVCLAHAGTESLRERAPFAAPSAPAAQPANSSLAGLELTGIVVIDQHPRFSLRDLSNSKSYWLELNRPEDGLTITSYDATNNTATVQGGGGSRLLFLKEIAITAAPLPPAAPVLPAGAPALPVAAKAPPRPEPMPANLTPEQKKQRQAETEARMLVSDLMEISMQERARNAEAQRLKAAGGTPAPVPAPVPNAPK